MKKPKVILAIETSCDETAASVCEMSAYGKPSADKRVKILSNIVASSASLQAKYGGVIPEQAAREQIKSIIPVIQEALIQSNLYPLSSKNHLLSSIINPPAIDAIAVTQGPGLIGSLLVGVETAKVLSLLWKKPLIPVNHLLGHFYANWIGNQPSFSAIGLLVSGGHTDLFLIKGHGQFKKIGGTRDDAAGECFDKCARLLGLPYPGGPNIAAEAAKFKVQSASWRTSVKIKLPRPMIKDKGFDFSFSGLKTAVLHEVEKLKPNQQFNILTIQQLSYEIQEAIVDVLVEKTIAAVQRYNIEQIILAGGVAANSRLREKMQNYAKEKLSSRVQFFIPPPLLCTDNAAMIASAAFYNDKITSPLGLQANPNAILTD